MKITTIILSLLSFCLLLFSCSEVEVPSTDGTESGGRKITLSMRLPQISIPRSRSLTEQQEYAINSVHAIAFNTTTQKYICSRLVSDITNTNTDNKKTGSLLLPDDADISTILFIANGDANVINTINNFNSNTTLTDAVTQLKAVITETVSPTYLPMLGQESVTKATNSLAVTLTRMVARINVKVNDGKGSDNFKIKEVYIYDDTYQALAFTGLTSEQESVFENTAYIKPRVADKAQVVIGAEVNGSIQYYSLLFVSPQETNKPIVKLAVEENHSYTFNINIVGEVPAGTNTPAEALAINTALLFDLYTIDDSWHNVIVTDECNVLCLNEDQFIMNRSGGDMDFLVFTDVSSGWALDGTLPDGVSLYTRGSTQACTNGKSDTNYYLTLSVGNTAASRKLTFTVKAGFLIHTVIINQP